MRFAIGVDVSKHSVKAAIEEMCTDYGLTKLEFPVLVLPNDKKVIFIAECPNWENIAMLEADAMVGGIWFDPELITELKDEDQVPAKNSSIVNRLNGIFKNSG